MNPRSRAIASTVAESRPPDNNTTAREPSTLLPRHVAPEIFMQLDLQAHRQPVLEYPVGELARRELLMTRRKQHRAAGGKGELAQLAATPLVVAAAADHELDQVPRAQPRQLLIAVAPFLAGTRRLDVDDFRHTRIDTRERHGAAGFQRDPQAGIAQQGQQLRAALLRERFASGHTHERRAELAHPRHDRLRLPPLAAVEGVGGVAILAAQRAAGEAHEHRGPARGVRLALQGVEDLGDLEARHALWPRGIPYWEGGAATRRRRSAASLAESLPGYLRVTSVSVARAAAYCFCAYCV